MSPNQQEISLEKLTNLWIDAAASYAESTTPLNYSIKEIIYASFVAGARFEFKRNSNQEER
jgi:hypothetical protein